MNNDELIIKKASVLSSLGVALKDAALALRRGAVVTGETLKGINVGENLLKGWAGLSKIERVRALRQLLKDAPMLTKRVGVVGNSGIKAEVKLIKRLEQTNSSIINRLNAFLDSPKIVEKLKIARPGETPASYVGTVNLHLNDAKVGIEKLHSMMLTSDKAIKNQSTINQALKEGRYVDLAKNIKLIFGAKNADALKVIDQISNLDKANKMISDLARFKIIPIRQADVLSKSIKTLSAPGSIAELSNLLGKVSSIPIVGFVALGALQGDTKEAVVEQSQIVNEIIKLLNELSGDGSPAGNAWESKKQEVISKLSKINSIDLAALESIDANSVDLEEAQKLLSNIITEDSSLTQKFESTLEAYLIIISPAFYSLYETGSQGIAQTVGEATDTMTGWLLGNVTAFNQAKDLAQKGATKLPQSAQKIARDARMMAFRIEKHIAEQNLSTEEPTEEATIAFDNSLFIKEANVFNAVHDLVSMRIKKAQLKKEAAAVFAAIGMVAGWIGGVSLATDLGNYISKTYISMGDSWDDLGKNIEEISNHLKGFIEVKNPDEAAVNFITATKEMIQELMEAQKTITTYFPLDLIKTFESGIKDIQAINKLSKEIVDGTASSKLEMIKEELQKVSNIYDVIIDPQSQYYTQFDDNVESYWHGFVEIFDYLTFFTGESAVSEFKRMIYKAKRGQAIANTLLNEIEKIDKTIDQTRTTALKEASKPGESEATEETV